MNKFEQLIEYVINDDEAKARELFHDIVVEKSRTIYEEMMAADEAEEVEEAADEEMEEGEEELEEAMHDMEEADHDMKEGMGGDQADDLIDDIETEESGVSMEGEDMEDHHSDMGGNEGLEDRVVDLEDKLDELMAEFESLMGDDNEMDTEMDMEVGDDMDSEEMVDDEMETEGMSGMYEAVDLKPAPKPVTSEEGGINKKSTVAANSGARGAVARPVHAGGDGGNGRPAPVAKDMGSTTQPNVKPAVKPHLAQAAGVNNKSVIQ